MWRYQHKQIIVSDTNCNADKDSAANKDSAAISKLSFNLQQSKMDVKCGLEWFWKVKQNVGFHSNMPINMPYISVVVSSGYSKNWQSYF